MEYATHHRFKKLAMCGEKLNLPYGTIVELNGDILETKDGKPICAVRSENAKMHFARNDDGNGLERGKLTYAIAYGGRIRYEGDRRQRFTNDEIELLEKSYSKWLRDDVDVILFNDAFFDANVIELAGLAAKLNIKIV